MDIHMHTGRHCKWGVTHVIILHCFNLAQASAAELSAYNNTFGVWIGRIIVVSSEVVHGGYEIDNECSILQNVDADQLVVFIVLHKT